MSKLIKISKKKIKLKIDFIPDSSKSGEDSSRFLNQMKMGSKSNWMHKTTIESLPSTISSGSKDKKRLNSSRQLATKVANKLPEWDSHLNMQQLAKNRTKLKTPNSDDSIEAYAKACRAKFDRKCAQTKLEAGKKMSNKARNQPIYTKPYSSDSYSDIQNIHQSEKDQMKGKLSDAYNSVTGSDGFLSPNSISIGVAANSTSNTTTHQYDTKISIGLQTTNTLERMPIIQLKKAADEPNEPEPQQQSTVRVNKLTVNKQLQVRPEALAYIIMFEENQKEDQNANSKDCGNKLYANTNTSKVNAAKSYSSGSDSNALNRKGPILTEKLVQFKGRTSSKSSSIVSTENLTLQECLQARRPDFYANAEQRRKCLNDLHNLR